jgi:hypothetical protein
VPRMPLRAWLINEVFQTFMKSGSRFVAQFRQRLWSCVPAGRGPARCVYVAVGSLTVVWAL